MNCLIAARHRLVPLLPDCFQLELPELVKVATLDLADATMLRVAAHAGSVEELLLRFADAARCPPEQGRESLKRGLEQGWLMQVDADDCGWAGEGIPDAESWLSLAAVDCASQLTATGRPELQVIAEFLDGLAAQEGVQSPARDQGQAPRQLLAKVLRQTEAAAHAAILSGTAALERLRSRRCPELVQFGCWPAWPGPVLTLPAGQLTPEAWLFFNPASPAARIAHACGFLAGPVLGQLDPAARCLAIPVQAPEPRRDGALEWSRLAVLAADLPERAIDSASRARLLALQLGACSQLDDAALKRQLESAWLRRWNRISVWRQVYGLLDDSCTDALPHARPEELAAVRNELARCARVLESWA